MKADTLDLYALFGKDCRYVVPLFQRPYVWTKDRHWQPLWEDIQEVLVQIDDQGGADAHLAHFMGAVVLDQMATATSEIETRQIIDGQQRLTTMQILLAAARKVASEYGHDRHARLLARLLENDEDLATNGIDKYKVWPTNADRDVFRDVMNDADLTRHGENGETPAIAEAYEYFGAELRSWISTHEDAEAQEKAFDNLVTILRKLLTLVVIDLEQSDDAQVIFETLNARMTPLDASDLVKNLLFHQAALHDQDVTELYTTYWAPFDTQEWRQEVRQGRLVRPRLDNFLGHYLTMRLEQSTRAPHLYVTFRKYVQDSGRDAASLMQEIARFGDVYASFDTFPPESAEGRFFERVRVMGHTTADPLLLYLFALPENELARADRQAILAMLESYMVRRMLCRLTASQYNKQFIMLLRSVKNSDESPRTVIQSELAAHTADSEFWPRDEYVRDALSTMQLYRTLTRARLRMVLEAVEYALRNRFTEGIRLEEKLTIEHLLPQKWKEDAWPLPADVHPIEARDARNRTLHVLGNLTLLNEKLNPSVSNGPWSSKRPQILEHSALALNRTLPEEWDEAAIGKRGEHLTEIVLQVWPRPVMPEEAEEPSVDAQVASA